MNKTLNSIYIYTTRSLLDHVIVDISNFIKEKYNLNQLEFKYSAAFDGGNKLANAELSLRNLLKETQSNFGKEIFKIDILRLIDIASDCYIDNCRFAKEYEELLLKKKKERRDSAIAFEDARFREIEYLSDYQSQYDLINVEWSNFWDQKIDQFHKTIATHRFPIRKRTILFQDKHWNEFNKSKDDYMSQLINLTEGWRAESKLLPSHLNVKCRSCNAENKLFFNLIGPGNAHTYGGNNQNTLTDREYLTKPEYGKKLKSGKKYYWRTLYKFVGDCSKCGESLLTTQIDGSTLIGSLANLNDTDQCAVYPHDDKRSWFEWCGVWMTAFEWFVREYGYIDAHGEGQSLFKGYHDVYI